MYLVQSRINPGFNRGGMYFPFGVDKEVPENLMTPEIMGEPLLWVRWHADPQERTPFLNTANDEASRQMMDEEELDVFDEPEVTKAKRPYNKRVAGKSQTPAPKKRQNRKPVKRVAT